MFANASWIDIIQYDPPKFAQQIVAIYTDAVYYAIY